MDHVGFKRNPRNRDLGFNKIWERYANYLKAHNTQQDGIHFHHHPVPFSKSANHCATHFFNHTPVIYEILARKIIDHAWFPSVYRPGFHTIRPDSHWFLEQFIPFDYSNQRMEEGSVYTWVDGGWQYHGESGTPNLVNKDQFVKNYYEQKTEIEKQTASNAVVAAVPPAAGFTPAAGTAAGFTSPTGLWGVPEPLPLLNMAPSYNPNLGLSSGYMPPTALWGNISMDALTQALTDITSGT